MTAKNDITGDFIKTKAGNDAYAEGWDRIFGKNKKQSEREKALDEMVRLNQEMGLYDNEDAAVIYHEKRLPG